ncbi:MAG: DUF3473 domain-containing protein [Patescibacteria group bacterium]|nr:DUF3473 domain-containing protein [Patescibacteria group bacterium]
MEKTNKEQFELDLLKSLQILQSTSGEKIKGFRAPFFSIDTKSLWAFELLRKHVKYDSSIFPVKTPLYGLPEAPRNIYKPSHENPLKNDDSENFMELPPATYHMPLIGNVPIAGGFHLRFLPYWYIRSGIKKMNKSGNPAVCYIHPKDLDRDMPRITSYQWYYYYNLKGSKHKYENLLRDFEFESVRDSIKI